jgi:hypothetical protein
VKGDIIHHEEEYCVDGVYEIAAVCAFLRAA